MPLIVRWPGMIEADKFHEIVQHHDWLPTFLAMAGETDIVDKVKKGYDGDWQDLQEPHRRLQPIALPHGQGIGKARASSSST